MFLTTTIPYLDLVSQWLLLSTWVISAAYLSSTSSNSASEAVNQRQIFSISKPNPHIHSQIPKIEHLVLIFRPEIPESDRSQTAMVLPLLKLGTLALKTLSKPLANKLKKQAALHPKFRQLIINMAQANHRMTTQTQRRIYGHATDVEIRPLNEEKAVQAAVDLIGELFVFTVGGAIVIFEVQRSARSEARKEEIRKKELEAMRQRDDDLAREVELLRHKLEELEQLARGRGLSGIFNFKHAQTEDTKPAKAV